MGKTYIGLRLQALTKALQFKEFQIWQLPCMLNHVRLQSERVQLARVRCRPAPVVSATILRHNVLPPMTITSAM